ncbi:MAG: hypothetical protein AB1898_27975 [Acidobacteriota bacterium]
MALELTHSRRSFRTSIMGSPRRRPPAARLLLALALLWAWTFCSRPAVWADEGPKVAWQTIRGVNFFPSYAANAHEVWQKFDEKVVHRELGWAKGLGFNGVRAWLSVPAYEEAPSVFLQRLGRFLDLCDRHQLNVMLVVFDCCGIEPRADATPTTIHQAYLRFLRDDRLTAAEKELLRSRYQQFAEGRGREMWANVGSDTPFDVLFWQHWSPNPGLRRLQSKKNWAGLEEYFISVLRLGAGHPRVIAFDVMNEPGCLFDLPGGIDRPGAAALVNEFVRHMSRLAREGFPAVVRTIGAQNVDQMKVLANEADVLSFHTYRLGAQLSEQLEQAKAFAHTQNKPLLLTECLANTDNWLKTHGEERLSNDEGQLQHYEQILPIIQRSGMGWYSWGFVVGRMFTPFTDILYSNGYRRPAAVYLEQQLRKPKRPSH